MTSSSVPPQTAPDSTADATAVDRRRWLVGSVAAGAALSGAGLAWWNQQQAASPVADTPADAALASFWPLTLATPGGQPLAMASLRGKPLLLNFWATWCPPCVEELPLIDRFFQENSNNGWQVLGLAVDQLAAVNGFLAKTPVHFPVALSGMAGVDLSKSLGNLSGSLPFTVVVGAAGLVLHRKMGRVSPDDLHTWAQLR